MRLLVVFLSVSGLFAQEGEIRRLLDKQVADWNRGDVVAFMEGYEKSESITFVGKTVTKGHARVLADYKKRYPTRDNMGRLRFNVLEVKPLGAAYCTVLGEWNLERSAQGGGNVGGIFTLLFHKTAQGWKIIQDHTTQR